MSYSNEEIDLKIKQSEEALVDESVDEAIVILKDIVKHNPKMAIAYRKLGTILSQLPFLEKALELSPDNAENWIALGNWYQNHKQWQKSLDAFQKVLGLSGDHAVAYYEAMKIHRKLGNNDLVLVILEKLFQLEPNNSVYLREYAKFLYDKGKGEKALKIYDKLLKIKNIMIPSEAVSEWLELTKEYGGCNLNLRERVKEVYFSNPKQLMLKILYAQSCISSGEKEKARELLETVVGIASNDKKIINKIAAIYMTMGQWEQALSLYNMLLQKNPLDIVALIAVSSQHKFQYGDTLFRKLCFAQVHTSEFSKEDKVKLHYALGKAYDDIGELSTAFEHYKIGGLLRSDGKFQSEYKNFYQLYLFMSSTFTSDFLNKNKQEGAKTKKPVFIIGMPRSGTTLMEQVYSTIDGIYAAGELDYAGVVLNNFNINGVTFKKVQKKDCFLYVKNPSYKERGNQYLKMIEMLAHEDSQRIIDKMPSNFMLLGLLHLILPNASFIHARRHPVETCLSAYRLNFTNGQYWADDLRTMGKYYRLYTEIMAHWKKVLPSGTILEVRYEDMVNDLETQSKRLVEHIGMEWSEKCLEFHKSERVVRTASIAQVRKPIYKSSINRWKKYEQFLKPLLDEIGDLVEEYELELNNDLTM